MSKKTKEEIDLEFRAKLKSYANSVLTMLYYNVADFQIKNNSINLSLCDLEQIVTNMGFEVDMLPFNIKEDEC